MLVITCRYIQRRRIQCLVQSAFIAWYKSQNEMPQKHKTECHKNTKRNATKTQNEVLTKSIKRDIL